MTRSPRRGIAIPKGKLPGNHGAPSHKQAGDTPPRPTPQAGRLFDHGGTVFFSVFMALWAVLFLEYWKRKSASLAYRWGCSDYEDIEVGPQAVATPPVGAGRC